METDFHSSKTKQLEHKELISSQINQMEYKEIFLQTKQLNNKELLSQTKHLVQKERDIHIQIIYHLSEIESRKLYLKQGFASLFDYATRELGYSEGAAYRRIKAMKLCRELPGTDSRLQSGRLSLSSACQLQVFFEKKAIKAKEAKKRAFSLKPTIEREPQKQEPKKETHLKENIFQFLNHEEKENLIKKAEGCSTRATAKLLSEQDPSLSPVKEEIRFLGKGRVELKIVIDEECHKRLNELKDLLSHKNPNLSYGKLLSILSEEALKRHDPRKRNTRQKKNAAQQEKTAEQKVTSVRKWKFKDNTFQEKTTSARKWKSKNTTHSKKVTSAEKWTHKNTAYAKKVTSAAKSEQKPLKIRRAIPSHLRKYIWERDKGQCTYVHQTTKRRCSAKRLLQIDHIQPFALGGKTEKENLRLLCAGHNRYRR